MIEGKKTDVLYCEKKRKNKQQMQAASIAYCREIVQQIVSELTKEGIEFTVEEQKGITHIHLDKTNDFNCSVCALDIKVGHLKGCVIFNH